MKGWGLCSKASGKPWSTFSRRTARSGLCCVETALAVAQGRISRAPSPFRRLGRRQMACPGDAAVKGPKVSESYFRASLRGLLTGEMEVVREAPPSRAGPGDWGRGHVVGYLGQAFPGRGQRYKTESGDLSRMCEPEGQRGWC